MLHLNDAVLKVMETAGPGMSLRIYPVVDQVHVLNSCNDYITTELFGGISEYATYPCFPAITHSDGSWVSSNNPATAGEVVTAYAFGLGAPDVPVKTVSGTPPGGLRISRPFTISFNGLSPVYASHPEYVGLVEKNAGLYAINFRVPPISADLPSCDAQRPSNLTMMIQGTSSSDGASFCVKP